MRILFLTKRQYMNRDLLDDRYGRFREIPLELARLGHEVTGVCFSYRQRPEGVVVDRDPGRPGEVTWHALTLGRTVLPGLARYWRRSAAIALDFAPDVIIGASDAFHIIRGERLARGAGAQSAADLYDNFESYAGALVPGVLPAFRSAVRHCDRVFAISAPLARKVIGEYGRRGPVEVLENGVRRDLFYPRDKLESRDKMGLPRDAILVGTAGALSASRDIATLFRSVDALARRDSRVRLVVAGPRDRHLPWPTVAPVHDLGVLDHTKVPDLFAALDVMVTTNADSAFGAYCHPQKLWEAIACGTAVVAAATGYMTELLAAEPHSLYKVGDAEDLAQTILARLADKTSPRVDVQGWDGIAQRLSAGL